LLPFWDNCTEASVGGPENSAIPSSAYNLAFEFSGIVNLADWKLPKNLPAYAK
jgi:hypothetical protein